MGDWHVTAPNVRPVALVKPRTTAEVAITLEVCNETGTPVVAQGGLTGLVGGAVPVDGCVLISLDRMTRIEEVDPIAGTITVEAGVTMQAVQEAADAAGLLFPLDIGGRGSCQIGGNISTNAGGNRVLRYGMARDLVLGMEAVLADGTVLTMLNKMLKNNAGYDLKHLFIGSEGTLGVVTRLVLRLFPKPRSVETALCGFRDFAGVYDFLRRMREQIGASLSAFELMWPEFYGRAVADSGVAAPLSTGFAAYVLVEAMGTDPERDAEHFSACIAQALEDGEVTDAVVAQSISDASRFWKIRDMSGPLVQKLAPLCNYDVSVETARIEDFRRDCLARLRARWPSAETICFGHLADSNLHMFVTVGETPFPASTVDEIVYACVRDWQGSISAEHGIGTVKRKYLAYSRTPAEIATMKLLKASLDRRGILNPGKVL